MNPQLCAHEATIDRLLEQMTLDEKLGQLNQAAVSLVGGFDLSFPQLIEKLGNGEIDQAEFEHIRSTFQEDFHEADIRAGRVGSFVGTDGAEKVNRLQKIAVEESRLGIPLLFGVDVIHGYRTIFPTPLAQACSWNPQLVGQASRVAACEGSAAGINWFFSPMLDVARDARWGRIIEGYGEDPLLAGVMAKAVVEGYQGEDMTGQTDVAACAKHFAGYGAAEAGRDYNTTEMSAATLYNTYLPPFMAAVQAGCTTFMSAFNALNGVPCTINRFLLTDVLRGEMGFDGFVVSDANAVAECMNHRCCEDAADAAQKALAAGLDIDMGSGIFISQIPGLLEQGRLAMDTVDKAVRRVLRVKFALGLFEQPYKTDAGREKTAMLLPAALETAQALARQSMVLLKNEGGVLPLSKDAKKLVVLGHLADSKADMLGAWVIAGRASECTTILEGVRQAAAPGCEVAYSTGYGEDGNLLDADGAAALCGGAGAALVVAGEAVAASMGRVELPEDTLVLVQRLKQTGVPVALVLCNGRPMAFPQEAALCDAVLETWQLGTRAGQAVAQVLFGDFAPCGKLAASMPYATGQLPVYYNHLSTGRPGNQTQKFTSRYKDIPFEPLYPFGYGLSYTRFEYSGLEVDKTKGRFGDALRVSVTVANVGDVAGCEVVQLYVTDKVATLARPVKELKDFSRVQLQPGEKQRVEFKLKADTLGYYDNSGCYVLEPGGFTILVGGDSKAAEHLTVDIRLDA